MQRRRLALILIPAALVVLVAAGLLISNFQEEVGIVEPGRAGIAAVAAAREAADTASGTGLAGYDEFGDSLRVALVEAENMPITNPAETRLQSALARVLDCLSATREAWQAELDRAWDPALHGSAEYWRTLHPALRDKRGTGLDPTQVRRWTEASAGYWLKKALDLVG